MCFIILVAALGVAGLGWFVYDLGYIAGWADAKSGKDA